MKKEIAPLEIKLFGEFEVSIGGKVLRDPVLRRSHLRNLLVLLALDQGRGQHRDVLAAWMWPEATEVHARNSFYNAWSKLGIALSGSTRECPYLCNELQSCRIRRELLYTDVMEFDSLSRQVIFEIGDVDERLVAVTRIEELYRGDILSGVRGPARITAAQQRYRSLMVDVYAAAAKIFSELGQEQNALWYANLATDADPSREEVYRMRMAAEERAGQRTLAIRSYFDCMRVLEEELGIRPSEQTTALYQGLILDGS